MRTKINILTLFIFILLSGCTTVPITDRRQLTLIPSQHLISLSRQEYKKVLKASNLSKNNSQLQQIEKVGRKIAKSANEFLQENNMKANFEWEFALINDDQTVNAWCMPGGKIALYTGILPYTQDEAGIAAVMGHEVAHAIAKHSNERMSQAMLANLGSAMLSKSIENRPVKTQKAFHTAIGMGTKFGVILPFSRLQESEADRLGLILMAKAGYDPQHAVEFWRRMQNSKKRSGPEFTLTHPSDQRRIQNIESHLIEAYYYYDPFIKD